MEASESEPGTPRQLRAEARSKIVTLQDLQGKPTKVVEVTDRMGTKTYLPLDNPEETKSWRPGASQRTMVRWRRTTRGILWKKVQVDRWMVLCLKIFYQLFATDQSFQDWKFDSKGRYVPNVKRVPKYTIQSEPVPYPFQFKVSSRPPALTLTTTASSSSTTTKITPADVRAVKGATERANYRRKFEEYVLKMSATPAEYFYGMTAEEVEDCLQEMTIEHGLAPLAKQLSLPHKGRKGELIQMLRMKILTLPPPPWHMTQKKASTKQLPKAILPPTSSSSSGSKHRFSSLHRICSHPTCLLNRDIAVGDVIMDHPNAGICHNICGTALLQVNELIGGTSTASPRSRPRK